MKIKRFTEQAEAKFYHVFAHYSDDQDTKGMLPDFYLFDNEKDAFNFLANYVYRIFEQNELDISILDEIDDVVDLIEVYEEEITETGRIPRQQIFYNPTTLIYGVELDEFIKIRRKAKGFNL